MYKDHAGNDMKEGDVFATAFDGRVDTTVNIFRLMVSSTHYRILDPHEFPGPALLNTFEHQSGLQNPRVKRVVIPKDVIDLGIEASIAFLRLSGATVEELSDDS